MDTPPGEAPQNPPPAPQPAPATPPLGTPPVSPLIPSTKDEQTFAMLAHLLGIATGFIGALVIWLVKREQSPFVNDQGKEALNFQITVAIAWVAVGIISVIPLVGCLLILVAPAVGVANLVFCILAGLKANEGVAYRYPFALRLIK